MRQRDQWLAATPQPGVYQEPVELPGAGLWDLTVTVRGGYVGEAHFEARVTGTVGRAAAPGGQPELAFGWPGWRLLALNWGHLVGFGLWVGVTALALADPGARRQRRRVPSHRTRGGDPMASTFSLCPACGACPEVEIRPDEVRIGEAGNLVVLKKEEWNVLVDLIQSGQLVKL